MDGCAYLNLNSALTPEQLAALEDQRLTVALQAGEADAYEQLIDRFQNRVALVAHVGGIDAAPFAGFGSQSNQFVGLRVGRGSVLKRAGNTDSTVFHGFAHQGFHLVELRGRGLGVVVA